MFIKLTLPGEGITRKVTFDRKPTWDQLSSKIEALFGNSHMIKADECAVSYVDSDGDTVVIVSNEELRDFYAQETKMVNTGTIKFNVKRLVSQSVPQVPHSVDLNIDQHEDDRDWDRMDRDPLPDQPMASIPMFGDDGGIHPRLHNMTSGYPKFAFIPGDERRASPAVSEARIEEVPSRSQSLLSTPAPPEEQRRPSPRPMKNKGKSRDSVTVNLPEDNRRSFSFNSDVSTPKEKEKQLAEADEPPAASLYNDVAGLLLQLSTVLTRITDGSYVRPGFEAALDPPEDAVNAARAAIEESAKNVERTLNNLAQEQLPTHPRPMSGVPTPNRDSGGRPRPWSMFSHTTQPPFAHSGPPPPIPPPPSGVHERNTPAFVPPSFVPQYEAPPGIPPPQQQYYGNDPTPAPRPTRGGGNRFSNYVPPLSAVPASPLMESQPNSAMLSNTSESIHQAERERLEAAKQLYKMEKANFRAQREAERQEREERKALREKRGAHLDELTQSLQAALGPMGHRMSATTDSDEEEPPQPVRPSAMPELFVPPSSGMPTVPAPWDEPPINVSVGPGPWASSSSRHRGPYHEQNDRIMQGLADMGFTIGTHPQLPNLVKQETRNNLSKSDNEIIDRIVEGLTVDVRPMPQQGRASGSRGPRRR